MAWIRIKLCFSDWGIQTCLYMYFWNPQKYLIIYFYFNDKMKKKCFIRINIKFLG